MNFPYYYINLNFFNCILWVTLKNQKKVSQKPKKQLNHGKRFMLCEVVNVKIIREAKKKGEMKTMIAFLKERFEEDNKN